MSEHRNESPAGRPASGPPEGLKQPSQAQGRQLPLVTVRDECGTEPGDGTRGRNLGRAYRTKSTTAWGWGGRGAAVPLRSRRGWGQVGRAVRDQVIWRPGLGGQEDQPGWKESLM